MAKRKRVQLLALKIEATSGTDSVPDPLVDAVQTVGIPTVRMAFIEGGNRDDVQSGRLVTTPRAAPAGRHGIIEATFEMAGSRLGSAYTATTSKPDVDVVLRGIGMGRTVVTTGGSESIKYVTLDEGMETFTSYAWADGYLRKLVGCVVSSARISATANGRALLAVTIMGKETTDPAAAASLPTIALTTVTPPLFHSGAAAIGSWNATTPPSDPLVLRSAEIDFGQVAADRPSAGASDGLIGFLVTDRKVRQTFTVESPLPATFDPFAMAKAEVGTLPLSSWQIGTAQYKRIKISTGYWALEVPAPGEDRSLSMYTLTGALTGLGSVSGRELEILFD